ncbi:MAG: VOC family protein [Nocardioides sp.]
MPATWRELCLDVVAGSDYRRIGEFWAAATGGHYQAYEKDPTQPGDVVGPPGVRGGGIALCPVPEPKVVKNRVHLDVHVGAAVELETLGAVVIDDDQPWTVMQDPAGNELCAFVRDAERMSSLGGYRVYELVVDAVDAPGMARWWADRFGVEARNDGEAWCWLEDVPGMPFEAWVFAPVPEAKAGKNRMHWDVIGDVDDFEGAGASRLWDMQGWSVLADPEGNEFCVFPPD